MNDASTTPSPSSAASVSRDSTLTFGMHLRWGWWSILLFLILGIVLEAMHGFKIGGYLNPSHATRRLMWTLAHAHGTLIGLIHLAFAFSVRSWPDWTAGSRNWASGCLRAAGLLIPLGFFFGGVHFYKADPGLGILLVPPGALLLLISVFLCARQAGKQASSAP